MLLGTSGPAPDTAPLGVSLHDKHFTSHHVSHFDLRGRSSLSFDHDAFDAVGLTRPKHLVEAARRRTGSQRPPALGSLSSKEKRRLSS